MMIIKIITAGVTQWSLGDAIHKEKSLLQYVCLSSTVVCSSTLKNCLAISTKTKHMSTLLGTHSLKSNEKLFTKRHAQKC